MPLHYIDILSQCFCGNIKFFLLEPNNPNQWKRKGSIKEEFGSDILLRIGRNTPRANIVNLYPMVDDFPHHAFH